MYQRWHTACVISGSIPVWRGAAHIALPPSPAEEGGTRGAPSRRGTGIRRPSYMLSPRSDAALSSLRLTIRAIFRGSKHVRRSPSSTELIFGIFGQAIVSTATA
ncbi:hypothetical protein Vretimale_3261 [Volvox reticuliferus]|uniref:Uncharacterized protein n=1 Tax=Volvox reticuliferus TaxID=1737510 RepID=A0A8J4DES1_9CHLO|nr:hypothetical protein Vretifemale_6536 [Volvox reticuliferus]GIL97671.1 hypothetical protein Vretimale_3261 [Volvox reticuliferus]